MDQCFKHSETMERIFESLHEMKIEQTKFTSDMKAAVSTIKEGVISNLRDVDRLDHDVFHEDGKIPKRINEVEKKINRKINEVDLNVAKLNTSNKISWSLMFVIITLLSSTIGFVAFYLTKSKGV